MMMEEKTEEVLQEVDIEIAQKPPPTTDDSASLLKKPTDVVDIEMAQVKPSSL